MTIPHTEEDFRRLPPLLKYDDLLRLGMNKSDIAKWVEGGKLTFVQSSPAGRRKYHKSSAGVLLGLTTKEPRNKV